MKVKRHKRPSESATIKTEVICPIDTNPLGILKGGRLVEWMDMAAAGCAQIHAGNICVTAAINHVDFIESAKTGDIISIIATMTRAFHSSMEIFVQAFAQDIKRQRKNLVSESYFTFVALDDTGRSTQTVAIKPVTGQEKKKFEEAMIRKKNRSAIKEQLTTTVFDNEDERVY